MREYKTGSKFAFWRWKIIDPEAKGEPYLERLHIIQTPLFAIMLHWINRPDPQPDMHDHPVSFLSIVLWGWYIELTPNGAYYIRFYNFKRCTDIHRITAGRALTLVFATRRLQNWGFYTPTGWVPWRDYKYLEIES